MTKWLIDQAVSRRYPVYTRANADDVMPDPMSPLCATLTWTQGVMEGWREGYVANCAQTIEELTSEGLNPVAGIFNGYYYNNASLPRIFGIRSGAGVAAIDAAFFGTRPDTPPHVGRPDDVSEELSQKIVAQVGWVLSATSFPELEETKRTTIALRDARPDLATLSDTDLVERVRSMTPHISRAFKEHVLTTSNTAIPPGILASLVPDLVVRLVGGAGDVDSAAPGAAMWELSRLAPGSTALEEGLVDLLRQYGSRGPNEWDVWSQVWEVKPALVEGMIEAMRPVDATAAPLLRYAAAVEDREAATAEAVARLAGNEEALATLHTAQAAALRFLSWRERSKAKCVRAMHEERMAILEVGARHAAAGQLGEARQVAMLTADEIDAFVADPAPFRDVLDAREVLWRHLWTREPPYFVEGDKPIPEIEDLPSAADVVVEAVVAGTVLKGDPGCAGVARGRARVMLTSDTAADLEPGDILVAPNTDPSWTPLFIPAAGVVVDVGAMNSHAVIVSRELGIPCAVSVRDATRRIPDGAMIEVNGGTGVVTVLSLP